MTIAIKVYTQTCLKIMEGFGRVITSSRNPIWKGWKVKNSKKVFVDLPIFPIGGFLQNPSNLSNPSIFAPRGHLWQ
jgi:hypothetical protein